MTTATAHPVARAADAARALLAPACERIEIAGSVRRQAEDPHDVELVLIPRHAAAARGPSFEDHLFQLDMTGQLLIDAAHQRDGPRYKRRILHGVKLDIFIVLPPAQWGWIYTIRTGPAAYSTGLAARWKTITHGGYSQDGQLHDATARPVPTPEELDVFAALQLPYIPPERRK